MSVSCQIKQEIITYMDLLKKMRTLNWLLQKTSEGTTTFVEWCEVLNSIMNADVYIVERKGEIRASYVESQKKSNPDYNNHRGVTITEKQNEALMNMEGTSVIATLEESGEILSEGALDLKENNLIVPIMQGGRRGGSLVYSRDEEFSEEDIVVAESSASILGIDIERWQNRNIEASLRKKAVAQIAIGMLTLTELEAVQEIFREIPADDGLVVADKIAAKTGIEKSVIMAGLKKLEISGVIESKTLGMKGTYIKVLNDRLKGEMERLQLSVIREYL